MFRWPVLPLIVLALLGCTRPATVHSLLEDARRYEKKGEFSAAVIQLKNLLRQDPRHAEARYLLGVAYLRSGEAASAEKQFREALDAKYDVSEVLPLLAQALFQQGKFKKLLEETRASDHGDHVRRADILSLRGHAQLSLGEAEEAAISLEEALRLQPKFPQALLGKARLSIQRRDPRAALALVNTALEEDPKSTDAWLMKGDLERALKRIDGATAAYRKAFDLNPHGLAANLNLASVHLELGQLDEARKHIDTIRETAPESPVGTYFQGLVEFRSANFAAAKQAADKILKFVPDYLPGIALSAAAAYSLGDDLQAEKHARAVLERQPGSIYMRKVLAATLLRTGKAQQALDVLVPVANAGAGDSGVLTLLGRAYYEKRDIAKAMRYFETAAKKTPNDPAARSGLGLTRLAAGEVNAALTDLEAALNAGDSKAEMLLVTSLLSAGKFQRSLAVVTRLEQARPDDPAVLNLKGAVFLAQKNTQEARKAFARGLALRPNYVPAAVNLAQLDVRDGNPQAAHARYQKILERESSNVEVMIALASLAAATGTRDEAIAWLQRAKGLQPQSFPVSIALAGQYSRIGNLAMAEAAARDAVAAQSENAQALDMLGNLQLRQGKNLEARTTYTKLASLYPQSPDALYGLSGALAATGNVAASELALKKVLELKPDFPEAIASLAALQMRAGKIGEALKSAQELKAAYPRMSLGYAIEGDAQMTGRQYERAARAYESAYRLERSAVLLMKLHGALRAARRGSEAEALLFDGLRRSPDNSQIRLYYADVSIKAGDFRRAAEQYEIERRKQPNNLSLLHNLAWCYEQLNELPRALEVAEAAYKINSDRLVALDDVARILLKSDLDASRAVKLLEKALTLAPESQSARYHLVLAYLKTGEKARARIALEELLRGRRAFPEEAEAVALLKQLQR